jgi:hypothetical protein
MRTTVAVLVLSAVVGGMWITFDLLARASRTRPINP